MPTEKLVLYGVVGFFSAILSGMGGGGGGFIATPMAIFLGLTPQQAIATGKINGLAISLGTVHGLRKAKLHSWRIIAPIMVLTVILGLLAPQLIARIDNDAYRKILGVILLTMIPVMFLKRVGHKKQNTTRGRKVVGYVLLTLAFGLQAVFSSGMGVLVNLVLMMFMGMGALEANITKRYAQLALNGLIFIGVALSGLVVWNVALATCIGSYLGGRIGAHLAIKKGDAFAMGVFTVLMFVSGLELLFG